MTQLPKTAHEVMFEKLAEGLDSTTTLTRALLGEIKESEADFASIKTELSILRENVKNLSGIINEGNGATSLVTRIALFENQLKALDKWIDAHADVHLRTKRSISNLKDTIEDLDDRIKDLESTLSVYKKKIDDAEQKIKDKEAAEHKALRESLHRENEISHLQKQNAVSIKKEKHSLYLKIIAAILLALVALGSSLATKHFSDKPALPSIQQKK